MRAIRNPAKVTVGDPFEDCRAPVHDRSGEPEPSQVTKYLSREHVVSAFPLLIYDGVTQQAGKNAEDFTILPLDNPVEPRPLPPENS